LQPGFQVQLPKQQVPEEQSATDTYKVYLFPGHCQRRYAVHEKWAEWSEPFLIRVPAEASLVPDPAGIITLPAGSSRLTKGSSWGRFTIACPIPIALVVGLYMFRLRKGRVVEASLLGAVAVIAATVVGNWVPGSPLEQVFSLDRDWTIAALMIY